MNFLNIFGCRVDIFMMEFSPNFLIIVTIKLTSMIWTRFSFLILQLKEKSFKNALSKFLKDSRIRNLKILDSPRLIVSFCF